MTGYSNMGDRKHIGQKGYIESISSERITGQQIQSIYEIEQDIWAHGLGSYIQCARCGEISSKKQVYGHLDTQIQLMTVASIEQVLGDGIPPCPCCSSQDTSHILSEKYRDTAIVERYEFDPVFLTLFYDISGNIRGFINAYISDFDTIYNKEIAPFYEDASKGVIKQHIMKTLENDIPDQLLTLNNMGAEQGYVSMTLLYHLLHTICEDMNQQYGNLHCIYDSILGNATHGMYHVLGGERMSVTSYAKDSQLNSDFETDVMFQLGGPKNTLDILGDGAMSFFRQHGKTIKNIVKV